MKQIYDDMKSLWHTVLGIIAAKTPPPIAITITIIYVAYQVLEYRLGRKDNPTADVVEYLVGVTIGLLT